METKTIKITEFDDDGMIVGEEITQAHVIESPAELAALLDTKPVSNYTYTREIKTPKGIQDGTANHVQMIINQIESGRPQEALYLAVDLLDQLVCGHLVVKLRTPMVTILDKQLRAEAKARSKK